jgi:hypothetical protein
MHHHVILDNETILEINIIVSTGRFLSNFLNFIFHGPPGLSKVDFMICFTNVDNRTSQDINQGQQHSAG